MNYAEFIDQLNSVEVKKIIENKPEYKEFIIETPFLDMLNSILAKYYGGAYITPDENPTTEALKYTSSCGGIRKGQTLYCMKQSNNIHFALLWPWRDGHAVTVKLFKDQNKDLPALFADYANTIKTTVHDFFFLPSSPFITYIKQLFDYSLQAILLLILTIILNACLIYGCSIFWNLYTSTHIGQQYVLSFSDKAQSISTIVNNNPLLFSIEISVTSFVICFLISAACQLFHLTRYFYYSRGVFGKTIIWGLPLAAIIALYFQPQYQIEFYEFSYMLVLIPTLCVFPSCFKYTSKLIPEIGQVLGFIKPLMIFLWSQLMLLKKSPE